MGRRGQAAVMALYKELAYKFEIPFEEKCYDIISSLELAQIEKVVPRGDYDSSGIDFFGWDITTDKVEYFFQCKGFQIKAFGLDQFNQCKKSIKSFIKSNRTANKYYLIINRPLTNSYRLKLNDLINNLVLNEKVKLAFCFDLYEFIDFVYNRILELLNNYINKSFKALHIEYVNAMNQIFYYDNIPFTLNNSQARNPINHIVSRTHDRHYTSEGYPPDNFKGKYFFIISEFGYGKTSLMLRLFIELSKKGLIPIYVPAAALSKDGFATPNSFCRDILKILDFPTTQDFKEFNNLKNRILKNILDNDPRFVLLIDGLDEHNFFRKDINLKTLFNWLKDLIAIPILSVRKEFWDERYGNFENAIGRSRKVQDKLILDEWSTADILFYLIQYQEKAKLNKSQKAKISSLHKLIAQGSYQDYYGDIPKRPLFLEMIVADVINVGVVNRTISELYEEFIKLKIYRDRTGVYISYPPKRKELQDMDINQLVGIIFKILEFCAVRMFIIEDRKVVLVNSILSEPIEQYINESYNIKALLDIVMNSILIPAHERTSDILALKFAHFSFLEFVLARHICKSIKEDTKWFSLKYEATLFKFIEDLLIKSNETEYLDQFI